MQPTPAAPEAATSKVGFEVLLLYIGLPLAAWYTTLDSQTRHWYLAAAPFIVAIVLFAVRRWRRAVLQWFEDTSPNVRALASGSSIFGALAWVLWFASTVPELVPRAGAPAVPMEYDDAEPVVVLQEMLPAEAPIPSDSSGNIAPPPAAAKPEPVLEAEFEVEHGVTAPTLEPGLQLGESDGDIKSNDAPPPSAPPSAPSQPRLTLLGVG